MYLTIDDELIEIERVLTELEAEVEADLRTCDEEEMAHQEKVKEDMRDERR